jgi:hypothetical protein
MKHGANTTIIVSGLVAFASVGCTPASEKSATERREGVDAPSSCVSSPTASSKGSEATLREMIAGKKMIPQNKTNGLDETFDENGSWASVAAEIDMTYRSGLWDINVDEHSREQLCTTLTEQDGEANPHQSARVISSRPISLVVKLRSRPSIIPRNSFALGLSNRENNRSRGPY